MSSEYNQKINEYWSNYYSKSRTLRNCWWRSPHIIRHVNKTVCGQSLDGWNAGLYHLLRQIMPEDSDLLDYLLSLDDETIQMGMQYYAVAIAVK